MKREILLTADGSATIAIPGMGVTYHSIHGALRESEHVFIAAGFHHWLKERERRISHQPATNDAAEKLHLKNDPVRVFEMGFGTGLNALLTLREASSLQQPVLYTTVEAFPLEPSLSNALTYTTQLQRPDLQPLFEQLHACAWEESIALSPCFTFIKHQTTLGNFSTDQKFDCIYYDAFAPTAQPELWTTTVFQQLYGLMDNNAVLTTYCSKGDVRRAMKAAGLIIEKIPGPPGKREIVRAVKSIK